MTALRKEPERRYASAGQLAEDVERYLAHRPVTARPDSVRYRCGKFVRRNRAAVSVAALLVVVVAAFTVRLLEERDRARAEATKAGEVADFMVSLFEAADPNQIVREQLTVRALLDQGARRVQNELTGEAGVQAHLMQTMGRVYTSLGLYAEAQPLLEAALAQRLATLGPANVETAEAQRLLGTLHYRRGDYTAARPLLEQALATEARLLGEDSGALVEILEHLFMLYGHLNDLDTAERLFNRSVRLAERARGPDDPSIATQLNNFALLIRSHDPQRAQALLERSVAIQQKSVGPDHPRVAASLINLAELRRKNGQTEGLEDLHRRIQAIFLEKLPNSPKLASAYIEYGLFLESADRAEEAREPYERAIAIYRKNGHPDIAYPLGFLADLDAKAGALDRAHERLGEALRVRETNYGPEHPLVGVTLDHLAGLQLRERDYTAAGQTIARALSILEQSVAANDNRIARAWLTQGDLWTALARHADAARAYGAAVAAYGEGRPDDYPALARARGLLGESLIQQQRFAEAEPLLLRSHEVLGDGPETLRRLATLYERWGKPARAAPYRIALQAQ